MRHIFWLLLAATLVSRLPFLAGEPYSWDSYNYYLAVEHFRPAEDMAHFPGYFNYVMAVKPLAALFPDANAALTTWSLLMSVLLVGLIYWFARSPLSRLLNLHHHDSVRFALIAATLTAINPMVWFYGEVGLGYINGAVAGVIGVWAILAPKKAWWQWALPALLIGWLIGFRLESAVLGLLWIRQTARAKLPWTIWPLGVAAGLVGVALWVMPTVHFAGSWDTYWKQGSALLAGSSQGYLGAYGGILRSLGIHLVRLGALLMLAAGFGVILLLIRGKAAVRAWTTLPIEFKRIIGWWTLPVVGLLYLFFMLPGYLLIIQPALTLLISALFVRTAKTVAEMNRTVTIAGVLSVLYFAVPLPSLFARGTTLPFSAARIQHNDDRAHAFRTILSAELAAGSAAILCYDEFYPWRAAMIDFPEVPAYQIVDTPRERFVVEGHHKRERGIPMRHDGDLIALSPAIRRIVVVRRDDDNRFFRDFPGLTIRDTVHTAHGNLYFASPFIEAAENGMGDEG